MVWCNSGFIIWNIARNACYYVMHSDNNKFTDTLVIEKARSHNVVWMGNDELKYKNRMFDIKKRITLRDKIILLGEYDEHEDKLYKALSVLIHGKAGNMEGKQQITVLWSFDALIIQPIQVNSFSRKYCADYPEWQSAFFKSVKLGVPSPPPDVLTV